MEYFDLAADPAAHAQFGPDYVINFWQDWQSQSLSEAYPDPVFTAQERAAMADFELAWQAAAESTSNPMPDLATLSTMPVWQHFVASAQAALAIFQIRGRLPEEEAAT
jgi:hypothetical protein